MEECAPHESEDGEAYDLTRARFGREAAGGVLGARPEPFRGEVVWGEPVIGPGLTRPYGGRLIVKKLVIALVVLTVCAGAASGNPGPTRFHVDTYMGPSGEVPPGGLLGSCVWWCGTFDYDTDGGYGNSWDGRLDIPQVDLTGAIYPVLTFFYRHDSEPDHDFTYVQAQSLGVYVNMNRGYDGYQPWIDIGIYGFVLAAYDDPFMGRFRFVSDGENSDEDEGYMSIAGAFMCDNIKVYDYYSGTILFFDDAEAGCASAGEERSWGSVKAIFR